VQQSGRAERGPDVDEVVQRACDAAGLSDFGAGDFREGLGRLLDALDREIVLSAPAHDFYLGIVQRRLVNRLQIEEWYRTHPEVAAVHVGPPVSITGLPRTGTTALANMMSRDSAFRLLRLWEQDQPVPPPVLAEEAQDPRYRAAVAEQERREREDPDAMTRHLWDPDATDEDVELLGLSFRAQQFVLPIHEYHRWWREGDMHDAYAYQRRAITLLQSRRPPDRWLFKAPAHSYHLEAFFAAYPDAKVVVTHRDPARSVPSTLSFVESLAPPDLQVDRHEFGRRRAEHLRIGVEQMIDARARLAARVGDARFLDVLHRDFVTDPFGTLDRIYDFIGREPTSASRDAMAAWHATHRTGVHGAHHYTAEQYGLTVEGLRRDFAPYIDRYGVPLEPSS
jgi:hypothetical protein